MARILLVDDDEVLALPLTWTLERDGHEVVRAATGEQARRLASSQGLDLILLDLGLPDLDGLDLCRELRVAGSRVAVMMLTGRGEELDRVVGLDVGADDYLVKPFSLAELSARIRALLRRTGPSAAPGEAPVGALHVDTAARRVHVGAAELPLTVKEYELLAVLERHRGEVVTRERLMELVWDENWFGSTKTLDVTVGRLRAKLQDAGARVRVSTARGVGFRLEEVEDPEAIATGGS